MPDINDQLMKSLTDAGTKLSKASAGFEKTLEAMGKEVANLSKLFVQESSSVVKSMNNERAAHEALELQITGEMLQKKNGRALTEQDQKAIKEITRLRKEEQKAMAQVAKSREMLGNISDKNSKEAKELQARIKGGESVAANARKQHTKLLGQSGSSVLGLMKKFNVLGVAITFLTGLLVGEYRRQKDTIAAMSGMLDMGDSFTSGRIQLERLTLAAGLEYDAVMKNITANRQAVNAMGGTEAAMNSWSKETKLAFTAITGDVDEAFKMYLESQSILRKQGVIPTANAMRQYAGDIQQLATLTGMASSELNALYNEVATDTDSMILLRSARDGEREAILASQRALINQAVAIGMSAEQAKEAAKMLNKMVAAKPIDRLKQAARMRAMGAAMGISGGDQAAQAVIAGPRASAEQKQALMDFSKSAANTVDAMRGAGLGSEIFATTLMEKLDMNQYYDSGSAFSTTMAASLKTQAGEFKNVLNDSALGHMASFQENYNRASAVMQGQSIGLLAMISNSVSSLVDAIRNSWIGKMYGMSGTSGNTPKELSSTLSSASKIGDEVNKQTSQQINNQQKQQSEQTEAAKQQTVEMKSTRTNIETQVKSLQSTNDILAKIHENSEKHVELAEKQLAATLMTEKERGSSRDNFFEGKRSFSSFGYMR